MSIGTTFLAGLGEPLAQLRALLRDVLFGLRYERRHAELDLIERQVNVAIRFGAVRSPDESARLLEALLCHEPYHDAIVRIDAERPLPDSPKKRLAHTWSDPSPSLEEAIGRAN